MPIRLKKRRNNSELLEITAKDWAELEDGMECGISLGDILKLYVLNGKGIVYAKISRITTQLVSCYSCKEPFEPSRQNSMVCSKKCFSDLMRMSSKKRSDVFRAAIEERKKALAEIQEKEDEL